MRRLTLAVAVLLVFSVSGVTFTEAGPTLMPHDPIHIAGNEQFTPENGVVGGSGTAGAPYIIEHWEIDAEGYRYAIHIENTDAHFVIRECRIYNADYIGIYLSNVKNGKITRCNISESYEGIKLSNSSGNELSINVIQSIGHDGLILSNSSGNLISYNTITSVTMSAIYLPHSSGNKVAQNYIASNRDGIFLEGSDENELAKNEIESNERSGIFLGSYSEGNHIAGNVIRSNGWFGISLRRSDNNKISGNNFILNGHRHEDRPAGQGAGISLLQGSSDNEIANNAVLENGIGIELEDSPDNVLKANIVADNKGYGFGISYSSGIEISWNFIGCNTKEGLHSTASSEGNTIHHNSFLWNNGNAYDSGHNHWDDGTEGNYWSDYTWVDQVHPWWIGDVPYQIPGGANMDGKPLIWSPTSQLTCEQK